VQGGPTLLSGIDLDLQASLTVCLGAVVSGKTNLVKALLGEMRLSEGSFMSTCHTVGLCEQDPWLPNASLRQAVVGMHDRSCEQDWYARVIKACCLESDVRDLSHGDQTVIGNRGGKLSGGQRKRLVCHLKSCTDHSLTLCRR
jgi:ATP-binding cassette subfamily C (CFTR/MRP) protein 1